MTLLDASGDRGLLLPENLLNSELFTVLAAFVAINTVMYVSFAIAKMLPKLYLSDFVDHSNRRRETRSIYPDASPEGIRAALDQGPSAGRPSIG